MTIREYAESKGFVISGRLTKSIRRTCSYDFTTHKTIRTEFIYWTDEDGNLYTRIGDKCHIITADGLEV